MTINIHKAEPIARFAMNELGAPCTVCGMPIRKVPGGNGMIWVHSETGCVVGRGRKYEGVEGVEGEGN